VVSFTGCGGETSDSGQEPVVEVDLANCDEPVGGLPWDVPEDGDMAGAADESDTGLQLELAEFDFSELPESVDISELIPFYRGLVGYALDWPVDSLGDSLDRDEVLAIGPMGEVVLASIMPGGDAGFDFTFYRRGLFRYYTCSLSPPLTLEEFRAVVFDFSEVEYTDVDSVAKCGTRRLYTAPDGQTYVSESLVEGQVRETEILLTGTRQDGNIDFLVYDADGLLTDRTEFPLPAVGRTPHRATRSRPPTRPGGPELVYTDRVVAAPYICMSCHANPENRQTAWTFDLLMPTSGPCPAN
jgi:hypothetical protein